MTEKKENEEAINNQRLCEILSAYYDETFHCMLCYFPHGNDFSMPYKPRFHSIVFGSLKRNILVEYTPDFPPEKADILSNSYDWNYIFKNSVEENGQKVFHGILNKVDRFDLTIPQEICKALEHYFSPDKTSQTTKSARQNKEKK